MSYQYITNRNSPNYTPAAQVAAVFGLARAIEGYTYHWWGDPSTQPTFDGVVSWLCRPGGGSSAHYVLEEGRVACIISPLDAAWHSGNARGNARTIGIEMNPRASEGDYRTAAEFSAQLMDAFGDQLKYRHSDWFQTQCCGVYDVNRIDRDSYQYNSGAEWGDVYPKNAPVQQTPPVVVPPPVQPPVVDPEWIRNLKDITDVQLSVLPAAGTQVINLNTMQPVPDQLIPRGTKVDIAKETTVGGKKFFISSWSATKGAPNGILAADLGTPVVAPPAEKPEWLKNLQDIADKDMYTRSETPVLNLADGKTAKILPINTPVRIIKATQVLGQDLLVVDGETTCIETVYLSDTPISNPYDDIEKRLTALEKFAKVVGDFLSAMFKNFNK
jgi:hypothetical protein